MDKIAADRAVLAIPFSVLKRVPVDPPFSPEKARTIADLNYHEAVRFLFQTKTRFWPAQRLTGGARTDGPADIWDMGYGQKSARGLISLTTGNAEIERKLAAMDGNGRRAFGAGLAKAAFPELDQELQKSFVQLWVEEPFARGAYTIFRPGQMTAWAKVLGRAENKVHFAGEHITPWNGWMEGAIWSGERVAQEILQQ
jgi:monoamine oxidase